jgi:hypothetical protein
MGSAEDAKEQVRELGEAIELKTHLPAAHFYTPLPIVLAFTITAAHGARARLRGCLGPRVQSRDTISRVRARTIRKLMRCPFWDAYSLLGSEFLGDKRRETSTSCRSPRRFIRRMIDLMCSLTRRGKRNPDEDFSFRIARTWTWK